MRSFLARHLVTWGTALVVVLVVIALFIGGLSVQVCRDCAFVCENTGSRKGYRQWCIGLQSNRWYHESHLGQFMRREHPSGFANRWTSYGSTGLNILGRPIIFRDAFPGPIHSLPPSILDMYVDGLDDQAKLNFYHVLSSGTPEEVKAEIDKAGNQIVEQAQAERQSR